MDYKPSEYIIGSRQKYLLPAFNALASYSNALASYSNALQRLVEKVSFLIYCTCGLY